MWKEEKKPVWEFLGWLLLIWGICTVISLLLEPHSVSVNEGGGVTFGYIVYAVTGVCFYTPSPMIAIYITLKRHKKIRSVKDFCKLIFRTPNIKKTLLILAVLCIPALCVTIIYGTPTGSPWYVFIAAIPLMIIGGGVEEIGWRGFLQPALEKKLPFPIATLAVSAIWIIWHLPLWFLPSSNHYGCSPIGFVIYFVVWSFILAAVYKATKSVFACVMHHSFINAIGAIYEWCDLFDTFPNRAGVYVYYSVALIAAIVIWVITEKKSKEE